MVGKNVLKSAIFGMIFDVFVENKAFRRTMFFRIFFNKSITIYITYT